MARKKLGDLLIEAGLIDAMQLSSALGQQRQRGGRLGRILVQMKLVNEQGIVEALSRQLRIPNVDLRRCVVPEEVLKLVPKEVCEKHLLLPWSSTRDERGIETLHVAMSDPTNLAVIDDLAFSTGRRIEVAVASDRDVELAIRRCFYGERPEDQRPRVLSTAGLTFSGAEFDLGQGGIEPLELPGEAGKPLASGSPNGAGAASGPLSLRERMLAKTLEVELGTEELPDRQLLLALARLLIRKGLISEDEWISEIARR